MQNRVVWLHVIKERQLYGDCVIVARVSSIMPELALVRCVASIDQAMLAAVYSGGLCGVRQGDDCLTADESNVSGMSQQSVAFGIAMVYLLLGWRVMQAAIKVGGNDTVA